MPIKHLKHILLFAILNYAPSIFAEISLPAIFSDNMVLQQNKPLNIWGYGESREEVTVNLVNQNNVSATYQVTQTNMVGVWHAILSQLPAGGPYKLIVSGQNTITIENIMIGEVWVCSGQSNMAWPVSESKNAEAEIKAANHSKIRLFTLHPNAAQTPTREMAGNWEICTPNNIPDFSAVAYYFGRRLQKSQKVAIGLINTSWNGTPIEAWLALHKILYFSEDFEAINFRWNKFRRSATHPNRISVLYNGMIAPLIPYTIQGAIWYQGEANTDRAYQYRRLFPAMIQNWRSDWAQGDFPFLFVQLANFGKLQTEPVESEWAELREAQQMALSLPNTASVVAIDIGEAKHIHPKNKQDVGLRLALAAEKIAYAIDHPYSGPTYHSVVIKKNKIRIQFDHANGGLKAKDGKLKGFTIAGKDRKFVWANAEIDGASVVVWSKDVPEPIAVRYAWADNPIYSLYNGAGLPASPFRTDDWLGITADKR